jgi:hypothetical protein
MNNYKKLTTDIQTQTVIENATATLERLQATTDYIAMMADVDLPSESEEEMEDVYKD